MTDRIKIQLHIHPAAAGSHEVGQSNCVGGIIYRAYGFKTQQTCDTVEVEFDAPTDARQRAQKELEEERAMVLARHHLELSSIDSRLAITMDPS